MPDDAPQIEFSRFVSSVQGRLVARWDANGSSFGARVATAVERGEGAEPIVWDTECVVPLTAAFCARYDRELRNALKHGDLVVRSREDWLAWLQLEEQRELERLKEGAALPEGETREGVELPADGAERTVDLGGGETVTTAVAVTETKPEGRKKKQ
jgi:hypothetical protein